MGLTSHRRITIATTLAHRPPGRRVGPVRRPWSHASPSIPSITGRPGGPWLRHALYGALYRSGENTRRGFGTMERAELHPPCASLVTVTANLIFGGPVA
jgi:hypothetical protein